MFMTRSIRTAAVLALLLPGAAVPVAGQRQGGEVVAQLEAWYANAQRRAPGRWGVVVADQGGTVLWSVNPRTALIPASTVKLLTTGFARTVVGGDAHRPTRVVGVGTVDPADGTWRGSWSLELNGDPTLERPALGGPSLVSLAEQLRAIGIQRLVGPFSLSTAEGVARSSYPTVWSARHRGRTFAPPIGMITLNENLVRFSVVPGSRVGETPLIGSDMPRGASGLVRVAARTVDGSRRRLTIRADGTGWVVSGTIGVRARPGDYTVVAHDPAAVVEASWAAALRTAGIAWDRVPSIGRATPSPDRRVLAEVVSPSFDSVAALVNTNSINIGAEMMLLWGGGPSLAAQKLERHVKQATGLAEGVHLVDGSGLSDDNRVAPLVFTTYLARFPETAAGRDFPLLLPANGSGTLRTLARGLPARGVVRAKTGTLGNASTLVGYLGQSEGMLLVAAMYNGGSVSAARQQQWTLFRTLGANGVTIPAQQDDVGVEFTLGR
jgi:D-alanyl-D-alanine carboxypeptidase/D-alanyl-D-alanine-endopeptidase (penicillin-binding protein 4)